MVVDNVLYMVSGNQIFSMVANDGSSPSRMVYVKIEKPREIA